MNYIIGAVINTPRDNNRFSSYGFPAGSSHTIQNIRYNKSTNKIEYRFNNGKMLEFNSASEADALFDRIKGVIRTNPITPQENDSGID